MPCTWQIDTLASPTVIALEGALFETANVAWQ